MEDSGGTGLFPFIAAESSLKINIFILCASIKVLKRSKKSLFLRDSHRLKRQELFRPFFLASTASGSASTRTIVAASDGSIVSTIIVLVAVFACAVWVSEFATGVLPSSVAEAFVFRNSGQLGFPQLLLSATVPVVPSPRWKGI
ncbi:hypothetical protein JHK85_028424 [Glycine max]|nr:hypothetical protein JHK85_028424 [Glycine max]KAG5003762.1 hypothetical protein JHK86_027901 [Glycine max]